MFTTAGLWAPEVALALASVGAAVALLGRRDRLPGALLAGALLLLGCDAAVGAAAYAGASPPWLPATHHLLTRVFETAGLAAALAATVAAATGRRRARTRASFATLVIGVVLSFAVPLVPVLLLGHFGAGLRGRNDGRRGSFCAAAALALVIASQLLMGAGPLRLGALHLLLAGWAAAAAWSVAEGPAGPAGRRGGTRVDP